MEDGIYMEDDIIDFIELMQRAVPNSKEVFTSGNCGPFALILAKTFPGGEIKYIYDIGHAIYEYRHHWYDITGQISKEFMKDNNIEYSDAKEIFSHYGAGRAMLYLRANYKPQK